MNWMYLIRLILTDLLFPINIGLILLFKRGACTKFYIPKDKKLHTQKLSIHFNSSGKVFLIDAFLFNGSPITKNVQHLVYKPGFGYKIIDNQYFMGKKDEIKVEGFFK